MLRSRRIALIATAMISVSGVALAACGDAVDTTGRGLQVFRLGANNASGASVAAGEMASADKMMPYMATEFVFDGELPSLPDSAASYLLVADVSISQVAALAAALGVEGDVRTLGADMGGGWMVGPEDYSGATLTVSGDGMASWWFSPDPSVYEATAYTCDAVALPEESRTPTDSTEPPVPTVVVDPCPAPEPPAGVPDADAALANMTTLLGELGFDASDYEFDTYADDWNASVTGYLQIDGERSPLTTGASWGAEGALMWASGSFAEPQRGADYPLTGVEGGLARLNDQSGGWGYYGAPTMLARGGAVSVAGDTASETVTDTVAETVTETVTETVVAAPSTDVAVPMPIECDPAADCVLVDPMVPMEPVTVRLNSVELGLTMVWDADGTVWLLPAYVFGSTDGGEYSVLAVDDEYLDIPEVDVTTETTVAIDGGTDSGAIDGMVGTIDLADAASKLVGLAEDEATKVASGNGWSLRVVQLDGESLPVTMDYRTDRVNVVVDGGKVTSVDSIG